MDVLNEEYFAELPEKLVEDMLFEGDRISSLLYDSFEEILKEKMNIRKQLLEHNILRRDSDINPSIHATACGVDGAYAIEKLLSIDMIACAAVAVEGLTPPNEEKFWEKPHHRIFVGAEKHNPDSAVILRGLMIEMEIDLAVRAPHNVIFIDGSITTPLIYLNQAINKIIEWENNYTETHLTLKVKENLNNFIENYKQILISERSDKIWVSIPKYTTRRELGKKFKWPGNYDDRALLTIILEPGEFTSPIPLDSPSQPWHLKLPTGNIDYEFNNLLKNVYIIYYKPWKWMPAFRIEIAKSVAVDDTRISFLLWSIKRQSSVSGIFEPYPLYIADKMVKPLGKAIAALRQIVTGKMISLHFGNIEEILFSMHGYRTENGR